MPGKRFAAVACAGLTLALALFAVLLVGRGAEAANGRSAGARSPASSTTKVGRQLADILKRRSSARVVVALKEPASARRRAVRVKRLRSDVSKLQAGVLSRLRSSDFEVTQDYRAVPALAGRLTRAGLRKLEADPNVVRVDIDVGGTGLLAQSVPLINADDWHYQGVTGDNVKVAVLDTGLDTDHSDLSDDLVHQRCFLDWDGAVNGVGRCPNGSDRQSGAGAAESGIRHGVMTTGIITSKGTVSSVGVAPGAQIVAIKVLDNTLPAGSFKYYSEIVAALDWILNNRQDVRAINMSLGTSAMFAGDCDTSTSWNISGATAVNALRNRSSNPVVSFAASGNSGSGTRMTSPACLSNVISVGATDDADNVAALTNSNSSLDVMAPGIDITSTGLANGTTTWSGTSFASPHAAGCAALYLERNSGLTPAQIEARLEGSAVQVTDATNGLTFPRIDCAPVIDHFKCYRAAPAKGTTFAAKPPTEVVLFDQFQPRRHVLGKPKQFCNPADKAGEGLLDSNNHLGCYQIKDARGQSKFVRRDVEMVNQFGSQLLTVKKALYFCATTRKQGHDPPFGIDHYKCYRVGPQKGAPKFVRRTGVDVRDQFMSGERRFDIVKPKTICNPAAKVPPGGSLVNPDAHLTCFAVKPVRGSTKFTRLDKTVSDQFDGLFTPQHKLTIKKERELCVPSEKRL